MLYQNPRAFSLPPAVWLPNTFFLPFSLSLFLITGSLLGGYIAFHFLAPFDIKWWMTATWLGVTTLLVTLYVQITVIRRINFLSAVVQQDPRLVAGDAVAFALMRRLPCFGRSRELDTLQKSLVNLYRASFKGKNVVYDGFTQRSVISCDFDTNAEQRPFGVDIDDDDDEFGGNRSWYEREDDGLEEGVDRDQVDIQGAANNNTSAIPFLAKGKGNNAANNNSTRGSLNSGRLSRRNSLLGENTNNNSGGSGNNTLTAASLSGGARSLQRALLLSGVDPSSYVPLSNPNTPRGNNNNNDDDNKQNHYFTNNDSSMSLQEVQNANAQNSNNNHDNYGSTMSSPNSALMSARSNYSTQSCVTANSTSNHTSTHNLGNITAGGKSLMSPRDILLCEINPTSPSTHNFRQHLQSQPVFMQFDPLGDNNSTSTFDALMQGIPDTGTSLLVSIVRQISPGTPLSAITFPVHVLEPRSLLEKFADMFRHSFILAELLKSQNCRDPMIRLQHVTKFFLSAYYLQQGARKPYNPIHGEVFGCRMELPQCDGRVVNYVAEQVSHHPPVTFIRASCPGVFDFRAVYHAKTSLVSINCASSVGEGSMELTLYDPQQPRAVLGTYAINWPTLFVSGFLYGSMKLELGSTANIVERTGTGAQAKVDFARKGWISGEYDVVLAGFSPDHNTPIDEKNGPSFEGHWNREIYFLPNRANKTSRVLCWDGPSQKSRSFARLVAVNVPGVVRQSRAIWQRLTQSLRQKDVARSVEAKHEVEEAQRAWRKALAASGEKHMPRMFVHASQHLAQFPQQELWDLSKWEDTEECKRWFHSQVADVQIH